METTTAVESSTDVTNGGNSTQPVYRTPYEPSIAVWSGIILLVFFVIGIFLNIITILVIREYPKLQSVFMLLITSLCVSDLLSALVSPLLWYRRTIGFESWMLPEFFCKLYWGVDLMTSYATSLHIMMFSILRLMSISFPRKFERVTQRTTLIWIFIMWIVSIGVGLIPSYFLFNSKVKNRLGNEPDSRWPGCTINVEVYSGYKMYQLVLFPIFFVVPMVVITITSIMIIVTVRAHCQTALRSGILSKKQATGRHRKEKQAAMQLMLIVLSFFIGYMPFAAYQFWITSGIPAGYKYHVIDYYWGLLEYVFLRFSECLNPIFYNIGSGNMRKYTKRYVKDKLGCAHMRTKTRKVSVKKQKSETSKNYSLGTGRTMNSRSTDLEM